MELLRKAAGSTGSHESIGCVCGLIFMDCPDSRLDVEGRTAPSCRLTALCRDPEKPIAGDVLVCDEEAYIIRAVISDADILSAVVEKGDSSCF